MGSYQYRVYGLRVDSAIEIPELLTDFEGNPDVSIRLGRVPVNLPKYQVKGIFYQAIKDDFLFRMDQVGAFRVCNGDEIIVEPLPDNNPELMRVFLLGSVFGALLHQKGILALHGSAVAYEHGGLIITGRSSSGKSTLAASLAGKGYPFITDDISALHRCEYGFQLHHGIPQMKLWKDVINKLGIKEGLKQVRPSIEKYRNQVGSGFQSLATDVSKVIVLASKNTTGIKIREIHGLEKFELLKENTYRYQFINGLQVTDQHFLSITDLASSIKIFRVERPTSPLMIKELANEVENKIIKSPE